MNRNMMRGRGRGGGGGGRGGGGGGRGGGGGGAGASNAFVSSHMRSLESEMQLLQRKREALQYQQQRLVDERTNMRKRPYESDPPTQSLPYYQTQSSVQNFAHLYDGGSERSFGGPQPKRRPPVNVWDDNRFNVNQSSVPQRLAPYVAMTPQNRPSPMPLLGVAPKPVGRRMLDMAPKRVRSKFYNSTQFNPAPAPMPVKKTLPRQVHPYTVLRANEEPSKQLNGRLGLALGLIIRRMRDEYCNTEETMDLFNTKHMQRYMRQTIRERLTTIMLNRVVGKPEEIVSAYRAVYPLHTDKHILDNANVNADFNKFLKLNISRILSEKLEELLNKMKQLCEGKDVEVRKIIKPLASSSSNEEKADTNKDVILTHNFMNSLTVALIEEHLPQILPKHTQKILKMLDLETAITTYVEKNMIGVRMPRKYKKKTKSTESLNDPDITMAEEENNEANNDPTKIYQENTQDENNEDGEPENDHDEPENDHNEPENDNNETENDNELENDNNEPENDNKPENDDNVPENENNEPETAGNEDIDKTIEEPKSTESKEKAEPSLLATPKPQQYFVKVLGQPSLPNRADAYKFFSSLNAVTIKKHKVIQNLLVVGFDNEQDYEKAVAASDTVVGNCKLIIKTNDKQTLSTTTTPCKDKTDSEKSEAMLSPDLENQITDLLSTIKQEQAENNESNTEQTKPEESNTEQSETVQSDNAANTDIIKKEITTKDEVKEDETVDENSQNQELDETKNLDTIKEVDEGDNEPQTNVANVKNVTGKSTPMKTRQSVATPRTIRTRRSSKLEQLNN